MMLLEWRAEIHRHNPSCTGECVRVHITGFWNWSTDFLNHRFLELVDPFVGSGTLDELLTGLREVGRVLWVGSWEKLRWTWAIRSSVLTIMWKPRLPRKLILCRSVEKTSAIKITLYFEWKHSTCYMLAERFEKRPENQKESDQGYIFQGRKFFS